jgi:pectin lyase
MKRLIRLITTLSLAGAAFAVLPAYGKGAPDGFATGVTGGGNAAVVQPSSLEELRKALCNATDAKGNCVDDTPRVIEIDRTFDYTGSRLIHNSPTTTETGCVMRQCPAGVQSELALNTANFCSGRTPAQVSYDNAGRSPLLVGANKTLQGRGRNAGIKGTGLSIKGGVRNVIVQNITLSDINAGVIWGGDALTIDNADGVWIDHNRFARIGRQMIVTGFGAASRVTISHNEFDGNTPTASFCDGHHYWLWLFLGANDSITLARNYIHHTSGRGPHAGGMRDAHTVVHMVNNYFENLSGQGAAMSRTDLSQLLLEGNYFKQVAHPLLDDAQQPGLAYAPFPGPDRPEYAYCRQYLGRDCVANEAVDSGSGYRPLDQGAIAAFAHRGSALLTPMPAGEVPDVVPKNAGVGLVD